MAIVSSKTPDPGVPEPKTVASPTPMAKESSVADVGPADAPPPPKNSAKSESLLTPNVSSEDLPSQSEERIRPQRLEEYIGQRELKAVLEIAIQAAKSRKDPLDHLLLYGPPGLGKTTISLILATEMGVNCRVTSAPALERPRDIVGLLMTLQAGDILFIDEIHRLSRMSEELLYPAMEDFRLDITIGKGQTARIRSLDLQPFTLVGATTRVGALSSPLRDRFGFVQRLRFYEAEELAQIVQRTAGVLELAIAPEAALEIARRSRGTPRIANRLLKRVRDFAQVKTPQPQGDPPATSTGKPPIGLSAAQAALELFNVDPCGLDWTDRRMLTVMIEQFQGGPVGLETLAASTGEDAQTIEEVYEPYLLQIGYLSRTPRGRVATAAAWTHLGYSPPSGSIQLSLS